MAESLQDRWSLSAAQEGIWVGQQLNPLSPVYNTAECIEIYGPLDLDRFERSLHQMVVEAETLNLRFEKEANTPRQYVDASLPWQLHFLDLSKVVDPSQVAQDWMQQDLKRTVNLSADRLFAQALIRISPELHYWYQRVHHIATDGFGTSLLLQRVAEIYTALSQGNPAPFSHFNGLKAVLEEDFAYQASEQSKADRAYWLSLLEDSSDPISLSTKTAPISASNRCRSDTLLPEIYQQLRHVSQQLNTSWPNVLLSTIVTYMHRITGAKELTFGLPMMGRLGSAASGVPAMVMNIVPLRISLQSGFTFSSLVNQIDEQYRAFRPHYRYRYEQLRRDLNRVGGGRRLFGPIVNIMPFDEQLHFGNLPAIVNNISAGPVEDLAINIRTQGSAIKIELDGNPACYTHEELLEHQQHWLAEIQANLEDPDQVFGAYPKLAHLPTRSVSKMIKGDLLKDPVHFVLDRFILFAKHHPQVEAVIEGDFRMSYGVLLEKAMNIASCLVETGVEPEDLIAIYLPRSLEAISAILGVLLSGAAYLSLDPKTNSIRTTNILQDAQPKLLISKNNQPPQGVSNLPDLIWIDHLDQYPSSTDINPPQKNTLAYVVYTSGSTGNPKGVMVEHLALASFVNGAIQQYGFQAGDRVLQFAPLHFDASIEEIFTTLCSGATLVLREEAMLQSMPEFLRVCEAKQITILDLPTAFWHELAFSLFHSQASLPPCLRMVIIGGEAAQPERVQQWHSAIGDEVALLNTYGPSETTVVATVAILRQGYADKGAVPIGIPLPGVDVVVLDPNGYPVLDGEEGELFILGPTLAKGYIGQTKLTTDRFVYLEHFPGHPRAYKTNDRVFIRPDGHLVYVGRLDTEFKISGHRVDLTEIESILSEIPGIREAAVVGYSLPKGIKRLCAYIVIDSPRPSIQTLRQHLTQVLPPAIIPAGFNILDVLPKVSSGKVDRAALKAHVPTWLTVPELTDLSPLEAIILQTWEEILGQRGLTPQDDFFELGGQSLQTIQVASWLSTKLNYEIPIAMIVRYPTAAKLASALTPFVRINDELLANGNALFKKNLNSTLWTPLLPIIEGEELPLFCIHPAAGVSWCYMNFAKHMGSQYSLYGVQSPLLEAEFSSINSPHENWDQILESYIALIRQVQPIGPYRFLGWSFGGMIAQGMATQLQKQGLDVDRLILVDAYPSQLLTQRNLPDDHEVFSLLLQAMGKRRSESFQAIQNREDFVFHLNQNSGTHLDSSIISKLIDITRHNISLARHAPVPEQYHGDLLFFSATLGQRDGCLSHEAWHPFVTGQILNYDLETNHGLMMTGKYLKTISQVIASYLAL
ncbi:amino acid adenylation domain-containing protein [Acaryochloris marina NIES-2412]|uniref:amino acid adenylation domain-containing protein n=1 Tax=Acaryochloris marina TaxID=155978 RepID=UPI00405A3455